MQDIKLRLLMVMPVFWAFLLFSGAAATDADSTKDVSYFDMSLEDLMYVTVSTPSTFSQDLNKACATISVLTADQIKELGADNLYDVLGFLPGVEIMETYYGYTDVQFRGILQSHYNNKSSLLLNGQPLYDEIISSYYLEQIPLSSIKQIEVVRGPGSVLYGTNAFAGVINIITKDGKSVNGSEALIKTGSFATRKSEFALGRDVQGVDFFFSGEYRQSDGYKRAVIWDEDDVDLAAGDEGEEPYGNRILGFYPEDRNAYENDYTNFFASAGYHGLTLNAIYFENQKDKFGIIPTLVSTGERTVHGYGINARYERQLINDKGLFRSIIWHDQIGKNERVNAYPPVVRADGVPHEQMYDGYKTGLQTQLSYQVSRKFNLLGGVGYEDARSNPYIWIYSDSVDETGYSIEDLAANAFREKKSTYDFWSFGQISYSPIEQVNIQAGGRFNNNEQAGNIVVPSVGVVYQPTRQLSLKCMFGMGFRNPSFFEKYVKTVDVLAGDQDLKPERIKTFGIGAGYALSKYTVKLNGFYTQTDNLIARRVLSSSEIDALNLEEGYGTGDMTWTKGYIYFNSPGETYRGLEFEFYGVPLSCLRFQGNATYKSGKNDDNEELKYFAPFNANASMRYSPMEHAYLVLVAQYVSKREGNYAAGYAWETWADGSSGGTDYALDPYTLIRTRLGIRPTKSIELALIVDNVLDEEYYYPEYIRRSIPFIPGGPGRSFYVEVGYDL